MTKNCTKYGKKLDNIYEFLRQLMTYFAQHIKIFYTTYDKCVGTYLPQNGFGCAVQLGSPLLERMFTSILARFSVIFC